MSVIDRRTFILSGLALATRASSQAPLTTFTQWLNASTEQRLAALPAVLARIRAMDPAIQAWVQVAPQRPTGQGPLSEIPFGAKDILETKGLATEYGSPIYKGRIGTSDAALVTELRRRGAILLGKTHSTAFAYRTPAPTRNPRNQAHTPGGSSSGSAAAVAADMVPFAIGTQTGGSVLRPASFCGVTGFKATYGLLPMDGVFPFAKSFDTLGFFTHTASDMLALWEALGHSSGRAEELPIGVPDPMPEVEPAMASAFSNAIARLRRERLDLRSIDIAGLLTQLVAAHRTVMFYEGARVHEERYKQYGDRLADMAALVREGLQMSERQYNEARSVIGEGKRKIGELQKVTPIILVPAATGPAPMGLASTGDSRMNAPWSAFGTPAISIPMPVTTGLPLGLQLTAPVGEDARVIRAAMRVERVFAARLDRVPPP
jgi:Asp-tRNA(Asn)/Glu-tRNA(Gln) amidotransferase A subunit family amidase